MKKKYHILPYVLMGVLMASGCNQMTSATADTSTEETSVAQNNGNADSSSNSGNETNDSNLASNSNSASTNEDGTVDTSAAYAVNPSSIEIKKKDEYINYQTDSYTEVALSDGNTKETTGVSVDGNTVTIHQAGTYVLSGKLTDGQVVVDAGEEEDVILVLNGVDITSTTTAPIYVMQADKVVISTVAETTNTITDTVTGLNAEGEELTAAIYSKEDLSLNGEGTLVVNANANDGITCKDTLKITGGTYEISAPDDGIIGKDLLVVTDGTFHINAGGDGMKSTQDNSLEEGFIYISGGNFDITAGCDGIQAETSLLITDGTFSLTTGGGSENASTKAGNNMGAWGSFGGRPGETTSTTTEDTSSAKGIKASAYLELQGGTYVMDTADDSIHTNGIATISEGTYTIASGDDGIHADDTLTVEGGWITITQSYEGLEACKIYINGGETSLVSSDDGLNAAGGNDQSSMGGRMGQNTFSNTSGALVEINGGKLTVDASGDGLDSNGDMTINGGEIYISGPTDSGNGYIDSTTSYVIHGGNMIGVGSSGMLVTPDAESTQISFTATGLTGSANDVITVKDSKGNTVVEYTSIKSYNAMTVTTPEMTEGETYTIFINGTEAKTITGGTSEGGGGMGGMGGMGGRGDKGDMSGMIRDEQGTIDRGMKGNGTVPGEVPSTEQN